MAMGMCLPARRRFGVVLAICLVASQGRAGAANLSDGAAKGGDKDAKQEAKARFVSGQSHYNLNEFTQALGDFKEAYRLLPDPVFLYNLGQCERQLGHLEEAIRFYRSFLREQPKAANRQDVMHKIDEMEATLKAKQAEADKGATPAAEAEPPTATAEAGKETKQALPPADVKWAAAPASKPEPTLPQPTARSQDPKIEPKLAPSAATASPPAAIPLAAPPADTAEGALGRMDLSAAPSTSAVSESPAFYSHWWFWPAVGVAAVAAGVGIYAATASRSPSVPSSALGSKGVF
jgi:tetratricopeptide (TPR) repeat protein